MELLGPALVGGLTAGGLYSLLAFSVVVLYKATGVANFAVGVTGTLGAFATWRFHQIVPTPLAVALGLGVCAVLGALVYVVVIRPRPRAAGANVIVRTLALALMASAAIDYVWSVGQPFAFPQILPTGSLSLLSTDVPIATLVTLAVAAILLLGFRALFHHTDMGLQFRAVAADRDLARLLGVPYRRVSIAVWAVATVLAGIVAILSANRLMLSTAMLDNALLYAFAAAITFGLTSLSGAVVGGLVIGVVNGVVSTYTSSEAALFVIFALLLVFMFLRPHGVFGRSEATRV